MTGGSIRTQPIGRGDRAVPDGIVVEWRTVALICGCYAAWALAALLWRSAPALAMPLLVATIALHSSLQHEAIHRHPTLRSAWNEALVFLPLGLLVPFRRYRDLHLRHHRDERLTDPYDDPESWYLSPDHFGRLSPALRLLRRWNNSVVGRVLIGPGIIAATFLRAELSGPTGADEQAAERRRAWALHAIGLIVVTAVLHLLGVPVAAYLVAAYLGLSLLSIRSFCEHRWAEDVDRRTVIVERSRLGWLFLNNNLHLVHHRHPGLAWYELTAAYRARRAEWQAANGFYVYRGYRAVLRAHAFRAKEPVAHPVWVGQPALSSPTAASRSNR